MKSISPMLTRETTMWKAWIGFNASHSSGITFIGVINCIQGVKYFALFRSDNFFFYLTLSPSDYMLG
jgi:hypothetical protein